MDVIKSAGLSDSIINNPTDEQNDINKYDMTSNNDLYRISSYMDKNTEDNFRNMYNTGFGRFAQYNDDGGDFQTDETKFYADTIFPCNLALEQSCPMNEECLPISMIKSRKGFCNCINDYQRNDQGKCVKSIDKLADKIYKIANDVGLDVDNNNNNGGENTNDAGTKPDLLIDPTEIDGKKLTVSINSKTVRLPEKEVQLAAYTIPDEKSSGDTYQYLWTLISQPSGEINGTMSDQRKDHVKLSNLSEGLYKFKVIVTGTNTNSYGETYANVTVLPEKHINKPPIVIITPVQQTVKLPTSNAILDGSTSTDDDKIVSWHWDLIQGPIGYQPKLPETSTLLLDDLSAPGNYTFRLTIADSDGAKNSTTASITVLKIIDYPPEANAGSNVIVYLPHNNVTLNGSLSTDDRKIVAWEWTKDSNDVSKAVDMQDTRTPYLKLSNLEEGIYTFDLKVTDESNQSSSAKVHVFVKKPTNLPPIANAGTNITINLPKTWTILNGTQSSDNIKIIHYEWSLISGPPSEVKILNSTNVLANVTGLTIGQYIFQLYVNDENNNNATDQVWIKVVQEKNTPPIANAGGDQSVTLPTKTIYLNGTKSNDDFRIVNFTWTRDGSSLAMGTIVGDSNHEPVLIVSFFYFLKHTCIEIDKILKFQITNIVPGRYVFKLTVTDDQGLTGTDTVSIIVHPDPMLLNLVEITLSVGVSVLTQSELESLEQKLLLLLGDNTMLRVRELKTEYKTGEAVLVFYVEKTVNSDNLITQNILLKFHFFLPSQTSDSQIVLMSGFDVEKLLLDKFWKDSAILGTMISNVRTVLCQNTCSGHGVCNAETRACMCETFWMPDIFYFWGIREANCGMTLHLINFKVYVFTFNFFFYFF